MKVNKHTASIALATTLGLTLTLTSCAGGGSAAAPGDGAAGGGGGTPAEQVFAEFNGMEGQARLDAVVEAAQKEGALTVYTTLTPESAPVVAKAFADEYGIEVDMQRMSSEDVITKVQAEQQAGAKNGVDLLELNGFELSALASQGTFAEFEGPERDAVVAEGQKDGWTADRLNQFVVARNTDKFDESMWPETIDEFADPKYQGQLSMEINEVDWFSALYGYYLEQGMSEDEIMALFKGIAANSIMVDGHATQMDQIAAGQYGVALSTYDYQTAGIAAQGAPLSYDPLVEPVVQRPNGVALLKTSPHPAAAYLFYTWILTDGQQVLHDAGLRSSLEKDAEEGLDGVEIVRVDPEELIGQYDEFADKYAEVTGR